MPSSILFCLTTFFNPSSWSYLSAYEMKKRGFFFLFFIKAFYFSILSFHKRMVTFPIIKSKRFLILSITQRKQIQVPALLFVEFGSSFRVNEQLVCKLLKRQSGGGCERATCCLFVSRKQICLKKHRRSGGNLFQFKFSVLNHKHKPLKLS